MRTAIVTPAITVVLAASSAIECGGNAGSPARGPALAPASEPTAHREPHAEAKPATDPPADTASEAAFGAAEREAEQQAVDETLQRLRAALESGSARRFAQEIEFPLRVNTGSRCNVAIKNAQVFEKRFQQIVTEKVTTAIKTAEPPYFSNYQGTMIGSGAVWFNGDKIYSLNPDVERIPGLPCVPPR